jgi:hypothetical protein
MFDDADEHVHCFPNRSGRKIRPEEVLAIAVIRDALHTLERYALAENRAARKLVAEVEGWFACNDADHPFAFVSICDALGLEVAYVRSGLRHWRESRHIPLRTEQRVLPLTGRRRPGKRIAPSRLGAAPHTSQIGTASLPQR